MSEDLNQELAMAHKVVQRQATEIERLRAALREIHDIVRSTGIPYAAEYSPDKRFFYVRNIAREALGDE